MSKIWVEFTGTSNAERASFEVSRISSVLEKGKGSIIVCDGQTYGFPSIPYESMLVKCGFYRSPITNSFGMEGK